MQLLYRHSPMMLFYSELFASYLTALSFCPQGAEAVDQQEARESDAAAVKAPAAPSAEERNPPLAGV